MLWSTLQGLPLYLAAVNRTDHTNQSSQAASVSGEPHGPQVVRKCGICEFATRNVQAYRDHLPLHADSAILPCQHGGCGSQFLERYKMVKHLQEKHDYPLVCHWCGASATSAHALQSHVALHFLQRHHECEMCEQKFHSRQQRDGHRFVAHGTWRKNEKLVSTINVHRL
ncbi:hypothetical protein V1264_021311 [Littorina saxatilis]|uniref:C2H2-type domain-containing protein n=2 Tax=Littorina saxatilis TaxID=31220 RepID=A0AAN9AHV7_9CAEN